MRRIALLFFGLVLTVGIVGCKKEETPAPAPAAEPAADPAAEPAAP